VPVALSRIGRKFADLLRLNAGEALPDSPIPRRCDRNRTTSCAG